MSTMRTGKEHTITRNDATERIVWPIFQLEAATHLQEAVKMPLLVWRKPLHQHADLASQVWLELRITDFEILQQLLCQRLDVCLIDQGVHKLQGTPPA